ncbi:unnamed protein product [Blepharisma stoltei]|uniref:Amino acid transporter transmembrane domain-containing protein n=1 Tax=Blepharisma stoltei TaxID=1481888 RepID=A0AAU9J0I5_9CILI|nr:unnamed protein product [Blepharisma stoltei]
MGETSVGSYDNSRDYLLQPLNDNEEPTRPERKWTDRVIGKMEPGSMRGSIFALISTAIGAGCLTIPLIFKWLGITLGLFMIFMGAFSSYYGLIGIALAADKHRNYNYPNLVRTILGKNWGLLMDITIILYVYGTLIGYQIMIGTFVPSIARSLSINTSPDETRIVIMCASCIFIMIPLGLMKNLSSLRFVAMLSAFTLVYITFLLVSEYYFFEEHNNIGEVNYFDINVNVFSGYAFCLYAFTCHTNIAQVQGELKYSNLRRIKKISFRTILSIMIPYIFLGLYGYLSALDDTPTLIIMRDTPADIKNDWAMVISKIFMSITLIFAVPINIHPCRTTIIKNMLKIETPSTKLHVSVTLLLLLTSLGIAIVYPAITVLFGFLGGFCCGIIVLILPALLRCKIMGYQPNSWQFIIIFGGFFVLFLVGSISSVLSIAGIGG